VHDVSPNRVVLLLLDHDRDGRGAIELDVEERGALDEQDAQLPRGDLEGTGSPPWP